MAPASGKRKRPERHASDDDGTRASPYRPEKSRMVSRRVSQATATTTAHESAENAAGTPVHGDASAVIGSSHLEPPASSANTPMPTPDATANSHNVGSQAQSFDMVREKRPSYRYTLVTDDVVASWADAGKQAVLDGAKTADELQIGGLLHELIRSAVDGRLTGRQAGHLIRDLIVAHKEDSSADVQSMFLSTLSFLYEANFRGEVLKSLVAATGIDQQTMRQELDIQLLQDLRLVQSTFEKMRTRKTTNALYRQANFNLLREESEGYAKLITDYFNTAQEASARHVEDPFMAEEAFQRVKALVGAFDLDVGRVLDITLDVSANLLVKAYPFFMKFYRASSWWPTNNLLDDVKWQDQGFSTLPAWALPGSGRSTASEAEREQLASLRLQRDARFWDEVRESKMKAFFEIGAKRIVELESILPLLECDVQPELDSRGKEGNPHKRERINEDRRYMRETGCVPPSGNYDAAQLLGFKLRFYASNARDANDVLPDNLIYLAALLIKIGFISLRDLYPHLHPSDDDMAQEKSRLEKEKAEKEAKDRPGGGANALLMAGALSDDTPAPRPTRIEKDKSGGATPAQDKKDEPNEELPPPSNQKLLLLKALLLIGALPEALYILGRFPWLAEVDVTLPPYLHRIAKQMLSKISESIKPLSDQESLQESKERLGETTVRLDGTLLFLPGPPKRTTRWLHNDGFDKEGVEFRHYYGDWPDNVPVCQTFDDVYLLCDTFINYIGPKVGQDPSLYGTLLRLAEHSLSEDGSSMNRSRWLVLMRRLLVPALSCGAHNPQLTHQLYELLKLWPTATRYNIYAEWFLGSTSRLPDIRVAFARNKAEVRDVLRRVSNDTTKKQGRALGKVSLASPGILMLEMISQLEVYSNMIPSLVECTRYFSSMAYDVLTWALINSLTTKGRSRMQEDGMLTSSWLQALAQFVATLFARYSYLNPVPILQYLASQLRHGDTTDLEMIEQILVEMAGIRSDVEFNDAQVIAMAGGEALQSHIMQQLSDTRHTKEKEKVAKRLMSALNGSGLTGQVLVSIAQERLMYSHHANLKDAPLKVVGNNLDKISAVFAQYLEVLKTNLKPEELEAAVPDAATLVMKFGVQPGIALTIHRTAIRGRMNEFDAAKKQEQDEKVDSDATDQDGDAAMKDSGGTGQKIEPLEDLDATADPQALATSPWHPVLQAVIDQLIDALPDLAARVSIPFFVTFWTLQHQDVLVPTDSYQRETKRIEQQIKEITADRSDVTAQTAKDRDRKKKELQQWFDRLKSEPMQHMAGYMAVRNRVSGSKTGNRFVPGENMFWFSRSDTSDLQLIKAENDAKHLNLLQHCFLPRATLSAIDAHFSFEMLKLMHANGTPGFSLMHLLNQLFKKQALTALIFSCTANEAQHFARFLWEVLKLLHRWHADKNTYEREALGSKKKLPGFVKTFDDNGEPKTVMDFENFRRMLFNFHSFLNSSLQTCFESDEYMHIRNGIIVLKGIHQVFPALKFMGKNMLERVKKLSEQDPRGDLKLAAMSLRGPLQSREKQWVMPQAFRLGDAKDNLRPESRGPSALPDTPKPDNNTPKLNVSAAEFKPGLANGRKESMAGGPEDGEIEDEKHAAAKVADTEMKVAPEESKMDAKLAEQDKQKPADSRPLASREAGRAESQVSTPASLPSKVVPHPGGPLRSDSRPSSTRPPQDLPPRPDSALKPPSGLPMARGGGRYGPRDEGRVRDDRYGRLERPGDGRSPSRDQSPGHRGPRGRTPPGVATRGPYRDERPYERPGDRGYSGREDLHLSRRDGPSREAVNTQSRTPQELRDRPTANSPSSDNNMHPDRMSHLPSVVAVPSEPQQPSTSGPQAQPEQDSAHVNPARLAMITADGSDGPGGRSGRDRATAEKNLRRERDGRSEERGPGPYHPKPDSRQSGHRPPDGPRDNAPRPDPPSDLAPTGPRHSRLRDMGPPQVESNYGRLNGPEPPAGPKNGPGNRGGRNFTAPQSLNTRPYEAPTLSASQSRPPDSPVTLRGLPRQSTGPVPQLDLQSAPNSAPSTPASEGPPVHPSRAARLEQTVPIPANIPPPNGPRNASSPINAPPSAPRGPGRHGPPVGTPTGPGPANNIPPSGPASATERQKRQQDRQRASINATLQAAGPNAQGMQFKGASSRQSSMSQVSPVTRGGPPAVASAMEPPLGRPPYEDHGGVRTDLFPRPERTDDRGSRREDERSNHGSRHHSRERPEESLRPPAPFADDGRVRRNAPRDERLQREERPRAGVREAQRGEHRAERPPRPEEGQPRRAPLEAQRPYGASSPGDWQRGQHAADESRRSGGGGHLAGPGPRIEDFRGPAHRRETDRREAGSSRGSLRNDGPAPDGRKRRNEEPSNFEGSKRRRSVR